MVKVEPFQFYLASSVLLTGCWTRLTLRLGGDNVELEALRALQYEGSKLEVAQGFRENGNEMARAKMWKDAREFYSRGIAVLTEKDRGTEGVGVDKTISAIEDDGEDDTVKMREVEEACYINRALCNLELSKITSQPHMIRELIG